MAKAKSSKKKAVKVKPREDLNHLGSAQTNYPTTYDPSILECFDNRNPQSESWVTFLCTEFTSLCPKTNQPDFARITINYIANKKMVESKSLKLYLFSFRNHGDFHEDCIQTICDDLAKLMNPFYLEVIGEFTPRGGIAIYPFSQYSSSTKKFKGLLNTRKAAYFPGAYTCDYSKIY